MDDRIKPVLRWIWCIFFFMLSYNLVWSASYNGGMPRDDFSAIFGLINMFFPLEIILWLGVIAIVAYFVGKSIYVEERNGIVDFLFLAFIPFAIYFVLDRFIVPFGISREEIFGYLFLCISMALYYMQKQKLNILLLYAFLFAFSGF